MNNNIDELLANAPKLGEGKGSDSSDLLCDQTIPDDCYEQFARWIRGRENSNAWTWNGDLEKPTIRPSVKTENCHERTMSHIWLNDGVCQHLGDSTDGTAGKTLPLLPLC